MAEAGSSLSVSKLIDGVARVDLRVRDVDTSIAFYRDVVGLEPAGRSNGRATLRGPGGPEILALASDGVDSPARRNSTGLFHTAFRYATRPSLGVALGRLVDRGIEVGAGDHGVSEALYIDDPDGNGIELYWDRPRDVWPDPAPGQRVAMYTAPVDLQSLLADGRGADPEDASPIVIGHVHLQVRSVEETVAFYGDHLGLDVMARMGSSAVFLASNGYHHHIGANTWNSRGAEPAPRNHSGLDRAVFDAPVEEIEQARARLDTNNFSGDVGEDLVTMDPSGIELCFRSSDAG